MVFSVNKFKTVYVFKNKPWNGRVSPGGKVTVGFESSFDVGVDTPILMSKDLVRKLILYYSRIRKDWPP